MSDNQAASPTTADDEATRAIARAAIYALLAQSFLAPTEQTAAACRNGTTADRLQHAVGLVAGGRTLSQAAAAFAKESRRASGALPRAHVRVFGYGNSVACPPYETEYTADHVFMKTDQMADVAGFYRAFGLQVGGPSNERPDHVSAELEFMHVLALKEALALRRGEIGHAAAARRAQRLFLRDHLARWATTFAERVRQEAASEPFYATLATLLQAFVERERARLRVRPRPLGRAVRFEGPPAQMQCPYEGSDRPEPQGVEVSDAVHPSA